MKTVLSFIFFTIITASVFGQEYKPVDSKSQVSFTIKNFGLNTNGSFSGLKGSIQFDPNKLSTASFNVSVDVNTVSTGIDARDSHLKKEEYFNAEKYSIINFTSTGVKKDNQGYIITGLLTIKGVSKTESFPFTVESQNGGLLFTGSFSINRKDFGVGDGSAVLGSNVDINLKVFAQ